MFNLIFGFFDLKWIKIINVYKIEWGFVRCDFVSRKVGYFLSFKWSLFLFIVEIMIYNFFYCNFFFDNLEIFFD